MVRLGVFLASLVINAIALAIGAAVLGLGYWLSDEAYAAGLWPVGAAMRVVLLFMLIGFLISIVGRIVGSLLILFTPSESEEI